MTRADTITILIGNSDDKLTQKEWAAFTMDVSLLMHNRAAEVYFEGGSASGSEWQNAAWVVGWPPTDLENLAGDLKDLAMQYRQDSIAVVAGGTTTFVRP